MTSLFAQEYRLDTLYHKDGKSFVKAYGTFSGIREGELEKKFKFFICLCLMSFLTILILSGVPKSFMYSIVLYAKIL